MVNIYGRKGENSQRSNVLNDISQLKEENIIFMVNYKDGVQDNFLDNYNVLFTSKAGNNSFEDPVTFFVLDLDAFPVTDVNFNVFSKDNDISVNSFRRNFVIFPINGNF